MVKGGGGSGLIWATAEDLARNRPVVLSLYRQILRALNSPELPLGHAARLAKKAECRAIFIFGAEERSLHNIRDLVEAARHTLGLLNRGRLP
jgi:NAD(P)-dependent dehydrogenase (short-subunit alcohol dehydrogenase family)